ncbi:MAG: guanylate kinase [Solirubrobacteraceae bacterium]
MFNGKLLIVSAPSGAGKTTLIKHLLSIEKQLQFSISCTTREKRTHETDGEDYYFLNSTEFKSKIKSNEFAEWEEVYPNLYYGTLKSEINRIWEKQQHIAFDIDVKGGINLKKIYKENALSIFIKPPTIEELEKRLMARNTDSKEIIKTRINKAKEELSLINNFDVIIENDDLNKAKAEIIKITSGVLLD